MPSLAPLHSSLQCYWGARGECSLSLIGVPLLTFNLDGMVRPGGGCGHTCSLAPPGLSAVDGSQLSLRSAGVCAVRGLNQRNDGSLRGLGL